MYLDFQIKIKVQFFKEQKNIHKSCYVFILPALLNGEPEQKGNVDFSEINVPVDELSPLDADGIF